jgi:hypothetical protein
LLELKLRQQRLESEEDSKWLAQEEKQLLASVRRISLCDTESNAEQRSSPNNVVEYSESESKSEVLLILTQLFT